MKSTKLDGTQLDNLIGKTIASVEGWEISMYSDGTNVRQQYTVNCTDGTSLTFSLDGGCDGQYARIEGKIDVLP